MPVWEAGEPVPYGDHLLLASGILAHDRPGCELVHGKGSPRILGMEEEAPWGCQQPLSPSSYTGAGGQVSARDRPVAGSGGHPGRGGGQDRSPRRNARVALINVSYGLTPFATVTITAAEVRTFHVASRAMAVSVWVPLGSVVVSQATA